MSRHGDPELTRLNYVLWPDESIGPHTRVDIANEAASTIDSLNRQLLDAKRNEERAVAEVTKLLDDRQKGDRLSFSHLQLRDISRRTGLKYLRRARESEAKLHTLEAAVRAVRDDEHIEWYHDLHPDQALSKLYALVPEAGS